ncbi:amino acid adenylation domain-containing protein [Streptomyces eurocidicus]|nr:amino acid adenylation domain-containing protein [Streptomyces eurocidicus]
MTRKTQTVLDPIDDAFKVLANDKGQHSLWPGHLDPPPGWRVVHPTASRQECLDYVEEHWTDIHPRGSADGEADLPGHTDPARAEEARTRACVHDMFADQVARTPFAPALIWQDQQLTYLQLDEESGRIARYLMERGVGRGSRVGLCVERSPQMITALLGILKSGAAYVPLDPDYPAGRLRYVLDDAEVTLLLTQSHLGSLFPGYDGEVVHLDRAQERIDALPIASAGIAVPSDIAYVIHTSGSTGRPKGVPVTHRSLANHSFAVNDHFALAPGDRVLQCRSLSFDAAAEEIFPPLLHGATLVLGDDPLRQTFRALTQQVIDTGTTFLSIPTAFWHSWVLEEDCLVRLASESSLRLMIVAGEKAGRQALLTWREWTGRGIRWCNVYGPTEGTITSALYEPGADWTGDGHGSVPIGHPIENVHAYVLDDRMNPVPQGTAGELYIGGSGIAVGYLNKPGMTAEKFLPDPFSGAWGERMYRTGDLVRAAAEGGIEFIGRRDHQVKLRGYRIELGEIEMTLAEHPEVRAAVALVDETDPENKSLVCYVVMHARTRVSVGELMAHLRRHLPWYMIPAVVVTIDAFPLTPNGKIDRSALPALGVSAATTADHIAPRTPVEAALVSIWEELLQRQGISVDADFFQSGGHSLLAASLIAHIRTRLKVSIPARVLFESPTVEGLATAVTDRLAGAATHDARNG